MENEWGWRREYVDYTDNSAVGVVLESSTLNAYAHHQSTEFYRNGVSLYSNF